MHRIFIRGKGRKYLIADSAFKSMQVDARACWRDAYEHHVRPAPTLGYSLAAKHKKLAHQNKPKCPVCGNRRARKSSLALIQIIALAAVTLVGQILLVVILFVEALHDQTGTQGNRRAASAADRC
jgi:hypothetical protein